MSSKSKFVKETRQKIKNRKKKKKNRQKINIRKKIEFVYLLSSRRFVSRSRTTKGLKSVSQ